MLLSSNNSYAMMFNGFYDRSQCSWSSSTVVSSFVLRFISFSAPCLSSIFVTSSHGFLHIYSYLSLLTSGFLNWLNYQIVLHLIIFPYILHAPCLCPYTIHIFSECPHTDHWFGRGMFLLSSIYYLPPLSPICSFVFAVWTLAYILVNRFCWAYRITRIFLFFRFVPHSICIYLFRVYHLLLLLQSLTFFVRCGQCVTNRSRLLLEIDLTLSFVKI